MVGQLLQKWWIKPVALVLLVLILCPPALAQEVSQADACTDAERDAEANTNKTIWFIAGCLGGLIGLIIAYAIEPSPPATKLLGKSPEYVAAYTDCYKRKGKSVQTKTALLGCGVAAVVYLAFVLVVTAAASSEVD